MRQLVRALDNCWPVPFIVIVVATIMACALIGGCASSGLYQMSDEWCASHPNAKAARCAKVQFPFAHKAESWDQENLKRHDTGCPTAIFVAPDGNLEQCI